MMENKKIPYIWGTGVILSDLSLEEVAEIISERLFDGLPFGGKEECIYEEVPAVYIALPIMGFKIILSTGHANSYNLEVKPYELFRRHIYKNNIPEERISFDTYLYHLLKYELEDVPGIQVIEPKYE